MESLTHEIESQKPFSESLIWQLNRDFYQESGISAWSENIVPHHMTSNSMVGITYAELIFATLRDLAEKGKKQELVYILELGAGHGRLAFHTIKHLNHLIANSNEELPPYCYVISDIVEDNLSFFEDHNQFAKHKENGLVDFAFFDAEISTEIHLRHAKNTIVINEMTQPILVVANYFFDSIPTDLFYIENDVLSSTSVSIHSSVDPHENGKKHFKEDMEFNYFNTPLNKAFYKDPLLNKILQQYKKTLSDSYLFFPAKSINCLNSIKNLSKAGLILLTMDKGFHELDDLKNKKKPDIVIHGSMSLWVNFHAINEYCTEQQGISFFPEMSNFHLDIGCLLFLEDGKKFHHLKNAYQHFINDFGPDDQNTIKQLAYSNIPRLSLIQIIALIRLSAYDSTFFIKLFPRIKQLAKAITIKERKRLAQTMDLVWDTYFDINEPYDLAYEIGGVFYDLGYYPKALKYFQITEKINGKKADTYYNKALCHYQMNQDQIFYTILKELNELFPGHEYISRLESLNMG